MPRLPKYSTPITPPMCTVCDKVKYGSEIEARLAAEYREKEYGKQWPYWSFNCNCWHLTSTLPE